MEEKILKAIKEDYQVGQEIKNNVFEIVTKIVELEKTDIVKEYLGLKDQLEIVDYKKIITEDDMDMLECLFRRYLSSIKETNGIYVCMGTFMLSNICDIEHGPSNYRLNRKDPRAEYRIYKDIESYDSVQIPINKCDEFEKTHKVIIPRTSLTDKYYYELQLEFIKEAIENGQEIACKKVLEKTK